MSLPTRTLGKTNLDVSVIGFGGAPMSFLKTEQEQAADVIRMLLDEGANLIDTATGYPGSHAFLGEHLNDRRDDFVLVSKVGNAGGDTDKYTPQSIKEQVDDALQKMKTDHVDVMLLHSCTLEVLEADEALGALVDCRDAGKVRHVGYSGDNEAAAFACRLPDVAVVETSVSIADQHNIDAVLVPARKHNVGVIAKRPIANAAWRNIDEQEGFYKKYSRDYAERLAKMNFKPGDVGMNEDDWPALALRFTLAQDLATAIVGTTNPDHARANLIAARAGPLDDKKVRTIREKFNAAAADWPGLT